MLVTIVEVYVKEEHIINFIESTIENHLNSIQEPGNLRFDVLQNKNDPTRFTLYEAYETEEASLAHKETSHYLEWREKVKDWMLKPRTGIPHQVITPWERASW